MRTLQARGPTFKLQDTWVLFICFLFKLGMVVRTCDTRARETEIGPSLGLPGQSAWPTWWTLDQGKTVWKHKAHSTSRMMCEIELWLWNILTCVHANTTHTHTSFEIENTSWHYTDFLSSVLPLIFWHNTRQTSQIIFSSIDPSGQNFGTPLLHRNQAKGICRRNYWLCPISLSVSPLVVSQTFSLQVTALWSGQGNQLGKSLAALERMPGANACDCFWGRYSKSAQIWDAVFQSLHTAR